MKPKIPQLESQIIPIYDDFDRNFYTGHILPVRKFSSRLASEYGLNTLLCDAAALLHDIGLTFCEPDEHSLRGSEESRKLLKEVGFSDDEVNSAARMIKNHKGPYSVEFLLEDEVLRSADGMAHISEVFYTFHSYLIRDDYKTAKEKTRDKLLFEMEQKITIPSAKEMISKDYELTMCYLNQKR